jgi:hypothetical protein
VKPAIWIGALFVALVLGYIVYSSFSPQKYRCEVCMDFGGRRDCRTASASTREHALRTAITNACAELAFSKSETNDCERATPASVNWVK